MSVERVKAQKTRLGLRVEYRHDTRRYVGARARCRYVCVRGYYYSPVFSLVGRYSPSVLSKRSKFRRSATKRAARYISTAVYCAFCLKRYRVSPAFVTYACRDKLEQTRSSKLGRRGINASDSPLNLRLIYRGGAVHQHSAGRGAARRVTLIGFSA